MNTDTLPRRLRAVFSIDLRSLALFRAMLGSVLLLDLFLRSADLATFYTDAGVLPRKDLLQIGHRWHWSLHTASGELWWQVVLFVLAALFALALLVGYRTRLATIVSFVMVASLMNRNPLLLQGGDQLLAVICFWAIFLPLGARRSVDAALERSRREDPNRLRFAPDGAQPYFSVATVAVILQVLYLYTFTAILKTGDAWTSRFDAAFYAVNLQHFATPIGAWFSQFPGLLKVATVFVLSVEFVGPILVLLPFAWPWLRLVGLALLVSLHIAFGLMLHIGLFPLIDLTALSLLFPGAAWAGLLAYRRARAAGGAPRAAIAHAARLAAAPPAPVVAGAEPLAASPAATGADAAPPPPPAGEPLPAAPPRTPRESIVIHYDRGCDFCVKTCLILRELLLLPPRLRIVRAQDDPVIGEILERENSWVVTDAEGTPHTHWQAMVLLFRQSPLFRPLGWLMSLPPLLALGNRLYGLVATHREALGRFSARFLPWRAVRTRPTLAGAVAAGFYLYVVTAFNVYGLPGVALATPRPVDYAARIARVDQRWDMFAPYPLTTSSYPLVPGTLRSGEQVDLYDLTSSATDWEEPGRYYPLYPSYRWRKYLGRVDSHGNNTVRRAFGDWMCRSWNGQERERDTQLGTLEVHFVKYRTNTEGTPKQMSRRMVWRHWCFAEFAPKQAAANAADTLRERAATRSFSDRKDGGDAAKGSRVEGDEKALAEEAVVEEGDDDAAPVRKFITN